MLLPRAGLLRPFHAAAAAVGVPLHDASHRAWRAPPAISRIPSSLTPETLPFSAPSPLQRSSFWAIAGDPRHSSLGALTNLPCSVDALVPLVPCVGVASAAAPLRGASDYSHELLPSEPRVGDAPACL